MTDVSPDVSQYVDLTLFDADPDDLVTTAVANSQTQFPNWKPQQGNTELVLMNSLATIVSELMFTINRVPGAVVSTLLQLFNISQSPGNFATGTATITFVDNSGYTVPAGTAFQLTIASGTYNFDTTADAISSPGGATSVTVPIICEVFASAPNGIPIGTVMDQVVTGFNINTVVVASTIAGGQDPETNQAWLNRAMGVLQGISTTLVTASDFEAAALNDTVDGVFRAHVTDLWNPAANNGIGGTAPGFVTVSVIGQGGGFLSAAQKNNLLTILQAESIAGLSISVTDPTIINLPVSATIAITEGYSLADVQTNVLAALQSPRSAGGLGMTTDQWDWSSVVRYNDLITVITKSEGVDYVANLQNPPNDITLTGVAPLVVVNLTLTPLETSNARY